MEKSLRTQAINGLQWSLMDNLANSGITFLVGLVLARLLSPVEFGLLGILTVFVNVSNAIVDGGFGLALIRKNNATENDYNTVFYSNLFVSLLLMLVLIVSSGGIAMFFNQPLLKDLMPAMSLLLLINSLAIVQRTLLIKKIDFKTQAKISLVASIGSGIVGIGMALIGLGVWSLVAQQLLRQGLQTSFLWKWGDWRPRWSFSKESFRDLFGFGSKVLVANLINTFYKNIYLFVIGKVYTAEQLGQYNRAEQFNLMFTNNLTNVLQKVTMPVLSKVQDDKKRLRDLYRKITIYSAMITFPLVFGLAAAAKAVVVVLVGEKWLPAVEYLQIISCYGAIYPLQILNLNLLNVLKRSDLLLKLEVFKNILFIPVIVVGCMGSLRGMLWMAVLYYYVEFFINSYYSKFLIDYGIGSQIKDVFPIYLLCVGISALILSYTFFIEIYWLLLLVQILSAVVFYYFAFELWNKQEYKELKGIVLSYFRSK